MWNLPVTEQQGTDISFCRRQVPYHTGKRVLNLRDCESPPLKTGFHYVQVLFKTGFHYVQVLLKICFHYVQVLFKTGFHYVQVLLKTGFHYVQVLFKTGFHYVQVLFKTGFAVTSRLFLLKRFATATDICICWALLYDDIIVQALAWLCLGVRKYLGPNVRHFTRTEQETSVHSSLQSFGLSVWNCLHVTLTAPAIF